MSNPNTTTSLSAEDLLAEVDNILNAATEKAKVVTSVAVMATQPVVAKPAPIVTQPVAKPAPVVMKPPTVTPMVKPPVALDLSEEEDEDEDEDDQDNEEDNEEDEGDDEQEIPAQFDPGDGEEEEIEVKPIVDYPEGTPKSVIDVVELETRAHKKVATLLNMAKTNPEIRRWAELPGKVGAVKRELREYAEVKKGVRDAMGIKAGGIKVIPAGTEVKAKPVVQTAAAVAPPPTKLAKPHDENESVIDALTPEKKPVLRLVNQKTGKEFLIWTDLLAASHKDFELRLRKYTVGKDSKPGNNVVPSVYLMKDDKILLSLKPEEFIVMLNMITQLTKSGKMNEIFQAFIVLAGKS